MLKNTSTKISLLVGGVCVTTLLIFMGLFSLVMNWQIETNANQAIENAMGTSDDYSYEESSSALYYAQLLYYDEKDINNSLQEYFTTAERQLITWCKQHDASSITKAEINGCTYILQVQDDVEYGNGSEKYLAYVDITGELAMIPSFMMLFVVAALILGALGCVAGYFMGKRLDQAQLAQRKFFENTSHELKTPLTAIRGYAEGIETGVITDYQKTGRVIVAQTEKMGSLIEEILTQAKLESGSVVLNREPLDLAEVLEDCLMPFEGAVKSRNLTVDLGLNSVEVSADRERLEHALSNLLTNAVRYAQTTIRISCAPGSVRIWNDSTPLEKEELDHLFDRFYTGKSRGQQTGGSTGIGLAIAKEIIVLHGWKITARNEDGGISFAIQL